MVANCLWGIIMQLRPGFYSGYARRNMDSNSTEMEQIFTSIWHSGSMASVTFLNPNVSLVRERSWDAATAWVMLNFLRLALSRLNLLPWSSQKELLVRIEARMAASSVGGMLKSLPLSALSKPNKVLIVGGSGGRWTHAILFWHSFHQAEVLPIQGLFLNTKILPGESEK